MQLPSHEVELHVTKDGLRFPWNGIESLIKLFKDNMYRTGYHPKTIVAVGRGGMIPGRLLAVGDDQEMRFLGLRSYNDREVGSIQTYQEPLDIDDINSPDTLFIDDLWDTGQTMTTIAERCPNAKRGVLLSKVPAALTNLDFYGLILPTESWLIFPWESP